MNDKEVQTIYKKFAKTNDETMFVRHIFPDKFKRIVAEYIAQHMGMCKKLEEDPSFYQGLQDIIAQGLYQCLRKEVGEDR